ncbi:MAG: hypothetical protein RLY34_959 [Actinomycetota bacterium]|jgi:hypothetical protein
MINWLYSGQLFVAVLAGAFTLILGLAKRKPSGLSIGALAFVQLGLIVQLIASIVLVIAGERAKTDTVEFFAYLIVALMIPLAAAFWALIERTRWSTLVLGVGALTVAVMLVRMSQIWTGNY